MSWTGAFGRGCRVLLHAIVHGLALTRISPNFLTFIGLLINIAAAFLFGYATSENQPRMFLYAGLVIIGAGIFDMVDGRVARATGQVTQFGAFFDSVVDRYSDVALYFGLLVYYARAIRFFYLVLTPAPLSRFRKTKIPTVARGARRCMGHSRQCYRGPPQWCAERLGCRMARVGARRGSPGGGRRSRCHHGR